MTIIYQQSELQTEFEKALTKANHINKAVLFSFTEKIQYISPHAVYSSAKQLFRGKRFFWQDPKEETLFVGLGIAQSFQTELNEERFRYIEKVWNHFIDDAHIYNPFKEQGTGPLIMGGFSFDPLSQKDAEWSSYSNALFHLPEFMISYQNREAYLTINVICMPKGDFSKFERMLQMKEIIHSWKEINQLPELRIQSQEEIMPNEWKKAVGNVVKHLKNDVLLDKVVLARKMKITFHESILSEKVIEQLCKVQHESFIFALETGGSCYTGASPERLVQKKGRNVLSTCLAGSIKRGRNFNEDIAYGKELLSDIKNRHEHQLVVSMIAKVMNEFCKDVLIPNIPELMKMRDIQHLYTPVKGCMKNDHQSILQLVAALHPTPAMGGVPTKEALQIIREVECMDRGFYAAPVGWIDYRGNGEFAVAIRSGLLKENEAYLYAGCGVVADSNPEDEYLETKIKFRPMLRALGGREL